MKQRLYETKFTPNSKNETPLLEDRACFGKRVARRASRATEGDERRNMRQPPLYLMVLFLAASTMVRMQAVTQIESGKRQQFGRSYTEIKDSSQRTVNYLKHQENYLRVDSLVNLTTNCDPPGACDLALLPLPTICIIPAKRRIPTHYCEIAVNSRKTLLTSQLKYGWFPWRVMSIYGRLAKKYMCMKPSGVLYASDKFYANCLFVFWPLKDCQCNKALTESECEHQKYKLTQNGLTIFSLIVPNYFRPLSGNESELAAKSCTINRVKNSRNYTMLFNGSRRWHLGLRNGELLSANETNPLDFESQWMSEFERLASHPQVFIEPAPGRSLTTTTTAGNGRGGKSWPMTKKMSRKTSATTAVTMTTTTKRPVYVGNRRLPQTVFNYTMPFGLPLNSKRADYDEQMEEHMLNRLLDAFRRKRPGKRH